MTEFEGQVTETMEEALNSVQEIHVGDIVKGEVLAIEDKQVIVAILGTGLEGVIPAKELSTTPTDDLESLVKVGDELDLVVISRIGNDKENGSYLLSKRRLDAKKLWEEIEAKYAAGEVVDATITNVVKGGLVADLGIRAFIPASMVEDHFVKDFSKYKGQPLKCKIVEIEPSENRLILSHKVVAEEEKQKQKEAVFASIHKGDQIEGTVARLTNFGAFIDLGGVDGLVHVSEISHTHVAKPSDVLKVGEKVNVLVLSVDPASNRISLSIKDTLPGPWDDIEDKAPVDSVLTGTVKRLTSFGAFVELFPGVEGLVHISQIAHKHIATPHEVLKEGEEVKVKVLEVSPENQRIALSIKALEEKPEPKVEEVVAEEESYELPEESTGFTMGDILGEALKTEE
ncbi:30S ribosomal protein S1 [Enterococcus cecorum]|uniref:Ribosomal protein S1 n=1 Tax=Enterococcus cecorum DSM 20682 = ATCC 43198 TaxID=1121864 RepID=S1QTN8_9ENTE|nr:30S ribosomal protein S1 [Enterococcus cecorum]EOX17141.1 ribosomal protein S1 [Enterococcus cecorum DSM 20682 = ATCC 43198]ESK61873.1 ribosomal protein S1 [Enterococcus cecorum DSM 20682 = ATCC 43198]OJG33228.1 ribosomal protein S1 [Enterococcus cecorum DSM 20682 = ATCC 43198]CAI3306847.1 30S ribosomal protein S1 [Enterococcus cecorum DSM 20682 = ATCC 43198]SQE55705.1 30S ribosomal protein S1 [Enterococcus cecorum]